MEYSVLRLHGQHVGHHNTTSNVQRSTDGQLAKAESNKLSLAGLSSATVISLFCRHRIGTLEVTDLASPLSDSLWTDQGFRSFQSNSAHIISQLRVALTKKEQRCGVFRSAPYSVLLILKKKASCGCYLVGVTVESRYSKVRTETSTGYPAPG
jgi:hypothetical protein